MKKVLFLLTAAAVLAVGCSKTATPTNTGASTPKPSGTQAASTPKPDAKKAPATNPVPSDWVRMYDDVKGYEFMVPQGTEHKSQTVDGVDVYMAAVPKPYEIAVMV